MTLAIPEAMFRNDEAGSELRGARTGKVWRIGERVRIRVKGTDRLCRTIDYELLSAKDTE